MEQLGESAEDSNPGPFGQESYTSTNWSTETRGSRAVETFGNGEEEPPHDSTAQSLAQTAPKLSGFPAKILMKALARNSCQGGRPVLTTRLTILR